MSDQLQKLRLQLEEVLGLLQIEPENDDLKALRDELKELVSGAESLAAHEAAKANATAASTGGWVVTKASKDKGPSSSASPAPVDGIDFRPGMRCEIKPKEAKRWQAGVVLQRLPDYEYVVQQLFDSKEIRVKGTDEIREIVAQTSLRHDALIPGLKVRARYSADGKYYQAVVEKRTEHGCTVRFEGYEDDDPESVALEHVRLAEVGEAPAVRAQFEIPPNLVIQPGDSEDVKMEKRRKLQSLKRRAKQENIEQLHTHKQDSWLTFQAGAKRARGTFTSLNPSAHPSAARPAPESRVSSVFKHN